MFVGIEVVDVKVVVDVVIIIVIGAWWLDNNFGYAHDLTF